MPYDKKTGKHYDYTKEGISQYKKDTGKGMPYAPFKMSGHTLPGPNQNSALKAIPGEGDVFDHFNEIAEASARPVGRKKTSGQTPVGSSIEGNEPPQSYVDTAKKKVDVEVTVNDKKV